jgi:hypothetical protein
METAAKRTITNDICTLFYIYFIQNSSVIFLTSPFAKYEMNEKPGYPPTSFLNDALFSILSSLLNWLPSLTHRQSCVMVS